MSPVAEQAHVTLSGDIAGEYVVTEQGPEGELRLVPDNGYPVVMPKFSGRRATPEEFEAFVADNHVLPPDGEG